MREPHAHLTSGTMARITLCATALGIIAARAVTHSVFALFATCLVVGVLVGGLLRIYSR
jgi:hypothetical protein